MLPVLMRLIYVGKWWYNGGSVVTSFYAIYLKDISSKVAISIFFSLKGYLALISYHALTSIYYYSSDLGLLA